MKTAKERVKFKTPGLESAEPGLTDTHQEFLLLFENRGFSACEERGAAKRGRRVPAVRTTVTMPPAVPENPPGTPGPQRHAPGSRTQTATFLAKILHTILPVDLSQPREA